MEQLNSVDEGEIELTLVDADSSNTTSNLLQEAESSNALKYENDKSNTAQRLKLEQEYFDQVLKFYEPQLLERKELETPPELLNKPLDFYTNTLKLIEESSRLNQNVNQFLSSHPPDQNIRMQTIAAFWGFLEQVFKKSSVGYTFELKHLLRYGMLVTSAVAPQVLDIIKKININNTSPASVYYVDEWLQQVSKGNISQSVIDEAALTDEALLISLEHKVSQLEIQNQQQIQSAIEVDNSINENLDSVVNGLNQLQNRPNSEFGFGTPITKEQDNQMRAMRDMIKHIQQKNTQLETKQSNIITTKAIIQKTQQEIAQIKSNNPNLQGESSDYSLEERMEPEVQSHTRITFSELQVIRQMAKMCVGKRGNHFPILFANYFSGPINNFAIREQVLKVLQEIESIDYTLFRKEVKDQKTRSFPLVLLIPCYGQDGICWEPFEKLNRNTSAAKIALPMYSRDLKKAVILAVADYRWQFEKEKASHLWMEEGLTGWYFQWHNSTIKKGDIKAHFIESYLLWINWESKGVQKVDKEVRNIFWRFLPFTQDKKENLKKRSSVYSELLQKDYNRDLSGH